MDPVNPQTPPAGGGDPPGGEGPPGGGHPPGGGLPPGDRPQGDRPPLVRSRSDRVIGGVCAGVGRYLGVDALVVRVVAVALTFLGGLGALLYVGGLLLLPDEEGGTYADRSTTSGRVLTAVGIVALVLAAGALLSGAVMASLAFVVPIAILVLLGLFAWWMVSGRGPGDDWRVVVRRSLAGLAVLLGCALVFVAGGWATALGGGAWTAGLVIGAGLAIVVGAFVRPVRWLVLPAVSLGLGAGFVAAAGVDLDGGVGEREYRPATAAEVRDRYELGAGSLVVDLRDARLPAGDVPLRLDLGMGEALVLVPDDVCVASRARVGMGEVRVFDRSSAGVDVDWDDRRTARAGATRIVVDADIGLGELRVGHRDGGHHHGRDGRSRFAAGHDAQAGNLACAGAPRGG